MITARRQEEIDLFTAGLLAGFPSPYPIECSIDGNPIDKAGLKIIHFPEPEMLPSDCRIKNLGSIAGLKKEELPGSGKTLGDLSVEEQVIFIFDLLKGMPADVYVLEKYPGILPAEIISDFQNKLNALRSPDSIVVCLVSDSFSAFKRDRMFLLYLMKNKWECHELPHSA